MKTLQEVLDECYENAFMDALDLMYKKDKAFINKDFPHSYASLAVKNEKKMMLKCKDKNNIK